MKRKLLETKHPLCYRVIHQVDVEVLIELAIWKKDSKQKLQCLIDGAYDYYK